MTLARPKKGSRTNQAYFFFLALRDSKTIVSTTRREKLVRYKSTALPAAVRFFFGLPFPLNFALIQNVSNTGCIVTGPE